MNDIVICSDIHIGKYRYGKIDPTTGVNIRTLDVIANFDETIEYAIEKKVDAFVIAGDIFQSKNPTNKERELVGKKFSKILINDIPLYVLIGNHDYSKTIDSSHVLSELGSVSNCIQKFHIIDKPDIHVVNEMGLYFLPHVNWAEYGIDTEKDFFDWEVQQIKELSKKADDSKEKLKIFFGHFGTTGSKTGNSFDLGVSTGSNSRVIPMSCFSSHVWNKVYLGDIHLPQEMNSTCRHVGSLARTDFGEEKEGKGFYHFIDGDDEFISVDDREFLTLELDLSGDKSREIMEKFCDEVQELDLEEKIVRINLKINDTNKQLIKLGGLEKYLRECCFYFQGFNRQEIKKEEESDDEIEINLDDEFDYVKIFKTEAEKMIE